jgi:hypothetical protein
MDEKGFKKRALMLDTDVFFVQSNKYKPDPLLENYYEIQRVLPFRKLRLQIDPSYCVRELVQLVLSRVSVHPFVYGMIAKSHTGYELSHDDPVGEVAERGDSLRAFFLFFVVVCVFLEHCVTVFKKGARVSFLLLMQTPHFFTLFLLHRLGIFCHPPYSTN